MYFFWILWGIDAIVGLVVLYFFFEGLSDGTVSSFNGGLWFMMLAGLSAVLLGSIYLQSHQNFMWAKILAGLLAIPGLLFGLFFLILILSGTRWN
ncbi:osmoprotectant transporter permease [Spirosoma endophyticum]|uniref:Uncharacterized protein n=1 Tax=Spirosoma endophyticum TaxID=662367 RepID=A0A1I2AUK2_9BACT|nr:osmoprotectant transporter permease [Spirosoma endophyticum]SFE46570.1 hypothetical protein SAMN05216167_11464 [Spirosoma endophyticum]